MDQSIVPSTREQIIARQARLAPVLRELAMNRYVGTPRVGPEPPLPISDVEVAAWVDRHPFLRSGLAPHIARSLAYIDRFKRRTPDAGGGTV